MKTRLVYHLAQSALAKIADGQGLAKAGSGRGEEDSR